MCGLGPLAVLLVFVGAWVLFVDASGRRVRGGLCAWRIRGTVWRAEAVKSPPSSRWLGLHALAVMRELLHLFVDLEIDHFDEVVSFGSVVLW